MIKFYQNVLANDELQKVRNTLNEPHWGFGFFSNEMNKPIWGFDKKYSWPLIEFFKDKIIEYDVVDIHVNGQTFGQQTSVHIDTGNGATHSFVFFPDEWTYTDGGRLHIFNGKIPSVVTPTANLGVLFNAQFEHYAESPNGINFRRSIGLKLKRKTNGQS
jgi:hypothetical protein